MDERGFKSKIGALLAQGDYFSFNTYDTSRPGVPDVFACKNGLSVWMELKYNDKGLKLKHPLTVRQSVFLRDINAVGGLGLVVVGCGGGEVVWDVVDEVGKKSDFSDFKPEPIDKFMEYLDRVCLSPRSRRPTCGSVEEEAPDPA